MKTRKNLFHLFSMLLLVSMLLVAAALPRPKHLLQRITADG